MKVLLVNGSPKQFGCTYTALSLIEKTLNLEGIETEIFWLGNDAISGCKGCGACRNLKKCVINDIVNVFNDKASTADGFIFGSPVHFAGASGNITSFLDRVFYSGKRNFLLKPASVVASARRAGTTATLDQLTKYLTISQMPVVSSKYWNMVHGNAPEDVLRDEEGLQTMRVLAKNMAYLLKCIDAGKKAGIPLPEKETPIATNFIR